MKVITQAPIRISLLGGGTDVGEYAEKYGGVCVNMAINIRQKFILDTESRITSLIPGDSAKFIRAFVSNNFGIRHEFDGFIHGGLGTSASAAVALVAGMAKIAGQTLERGDIAELAWDIEVNKLGLFGGKQDQYCATFGGMNEMLFNGKVGVFPVPHPEPKDILLFDTGIRRKKKDIQEGLRYLDKKKKKALNKLKHLAELYNPADLGGLLDLAWDYKKESNKVSTPAIDYLYEKGKKLGAKGGKLCGSGGGGYMIFCVPEDKHEYFKEKIGLKWIDYSVDYNGVETRIL